jgi:hypothetical protein
LPVRASGFISRVISSGAEQIGAGAACATVAAGVAGLSSACTPLAAITAQAAAMPQALTRNVERRKGRGTNIVIASASL